MTGIRDFSTKYGADRKDARRRVKHGEHAGTHITNHASSFRKGLSCRARRDGSPQPTMQPCVEWVSPALPVLKSICGARLASRYGRRISSGSLWLGAGLAGTVVMLGDLC
jgi:hypothetical protein